MNPRITPTKTHLDWPLAFSELGKRANNQDYIYPEIGKASAKDRLFLVCDGIGGADKGEEASRIVAQAIASSIGAARMDEKSIGEALLRAHQHLVDYCRAHPLVNRMGTTLALLQFHDEGATAVHIGDSRIYHIRQQQILFQSVDHKQVNDMVAAGIITAEQAKTHPWRNRLSRAVVAQTGSTRETVSMPDITHLTDVLPGDYFFLCTDGVLENLSDERLVGILAGDGLEQEKLAELLAVCHNQTKDNYSGYLLRVVQE